MPLWRSSRRPATAVARELGLRCARYGGWRDKPALETPGANGWKGGSPVPFPMTSGYSFTESSVKVNAASRSGVYGLYTQSRWIYVGETNDIQRRLLEHLAETSGCIKRHAPTGFVYELVESGSRVARQNALIRELIPACNERLG